MFRKPVWGKKNAVHQVLVKGSLNGSGFKEARFIAFFKLHRGKGPVVKSGWTTERELSISNKREANE